MNLTLPFVLKRFIAQFLMPVPLVIEFFVIGWALNRFTRFKRVGTTFKILAGCLFLTFSSGVGSSYIYRIERQYPPFEPATVESRALRDVDVMVLGQSFAEESDLPLRFWANAPMHLRMMEGVRVAKLIPDSRLLISMAGNAVEERKKGFIDDFAVKYGFERSRIIVITGAHDTADEARLALAEAKSNTVVVVTSAAHIPRAVHIFKKRGANPIPAPCDYQMISNVKRWRWESLRLPSGGGFRQSEGALYEWLGLKYEELTK